MMDTTQLRTDWKNWGTLMQRQFPHAQIPDIFPNGALWAAMVTRIADAHDLTQNEVGETIEDLWTVRTAGSATSQAA